MCGGRGLLRTNWWLRVANGSSSTNACYVNNNGIANANSCSNTNIHPRLGFRTLARPSSRHMRRKQSTMRKEAATFGGVDAIVNLCPVGRAGRFLHGTGARHLPALHVTGPSGYGWRARVCASRTGHPL